MKVCGLILAAGGSSRLGRPKQLVNAHGKSLLEKAIENSLQTDLQQVYVVLGAKAEEVEASVEHLPVSMIKNERWQDGIGSSISCGLRKIQGEGNYDAVLIMLCDQLHVTAHHLQSLINAYLDKKSPIIATTYGGELGVPALFDQKYFPHLQNLSGDSGAKKILHQHTKNLHPIPFEEAIIDVDTPEDLEKLGLG